MKYRLAITTADGTRYYDRYGVYLQIVDPGWHLRLWRARCRYALWCAAWALRLAAIADWWAVQTVLVYVSSCRRFALQDAQSEVSPQPVQLRLAA